MGKKNIVNVRELDPVTSFSFNIKMFCFIGLWRSEEDSILRRCYPFYTFLIIGLMYLSFLVSQLVYIAMLFGNVEEMVHVLFFTVTIVGEYVKMYGLIFRSRRIRRLLDKLREDIFTPRTVGQKEVVARCMTTVKLNSIIFFGMCTTTVAIWSIFPALDGSARTFTLPLQTWIPFCTTNNPQYKIAYVYEAVNIILSAFINSVYDTFVTGFLIHASAQLDILADNLVNIVKEKDKIEDVIMKLRQCLVYHNEIILYIEDIQDTFSVPIFGQFFASGVVLSVTMFQLTLMSPFTFHFITVAAYQICILYQLFLYCWFGNEVILKSNYISDAVYKSYWYSEFCPRHRKIMLQLMTRCVHPLQVRAGYLIPLSVSTYMKVLQSSWSYFALLRQVHMKE